MRRGARRRPLILALDFGTSSAKAALFDAAGARLVTFRRRLTLHFRPRGGVEQSPDELLRAARFLLASVDRWLSGEDDLVAAGIACQRSSIVIWDRATRRPIGPLVCWMDCRWAPRIALMKDAEALVARRSGLRLSPHYGAAHIARRLGEDPSLARAARRGSIVAGPVATFVADALMRLESAACDPTLAQRMLLYDPARGAWDADLCDLFEVPKACLPALLSSAGDWGSLHVGRRIVPVRALAGDQQAAAAAFDLDAADDDRRALFHSANGHDRRAPEEMAGRQSGRDGSKRERRSSRDSERALHASLPSGGEAAALVNYGTGAFALWPASARASGARRLLRSVRADLAHHFYLEGPVNAAGAALDALGRWIGPTAVREGLRRLSARAPWDELPLLVPAFAGLGAPHWDDSAQPVLVCGRSSTERSALVLAALAGIAHRVTDILEAETIRQGASAAGPSGPAQSQRRRRRMRRPGRRAGALPPGNGGPMGGLVLSGPLAACRVLPRLQAELSGRPVRLSREPESTLRGIARIAARAAGGPDIPAAATGPVLSPRLDPAMRGRLRDEWRRALAASRSSG